ncbi:PAS domain S-box protein [Robertmurraya korlensis]|uniref:PAS domain-containing sensor histidine kinase n=1 Tax=Robertmurraya korlensis TaxID=519977 RepID=UPI00203D9FBE|nr:PAS domain-containing sensor histidine kinase [Robertmurraya korlensis]MCM3603366.1 PAS domain S-box protein [Robertmurraya korlensis]
MNQLEIDALEILDRITDGFFSVDTNWNFTYINSEAARLLFRNREDLLGKNVWFEFPEAVNLPFYVQYHKAVREQVPVTFSSFFPPLNTWFDVRAYPSPNGLSVYFLDVTVEKKAASKKQQHYKSLFEQNPDAVFSFDLEGNYLSVNSAMERLLGYTEKEFLQLTYLPLVEEAELQRTRNHYEKAAKGYTQHYETKALHKDGRVVHVSVTNIPIIVDNEVVGVYGIAKDITDQKSTELQLIKSEKLSAVGQLSASIAHEIRNPLTALKGFIQIMRSSAPSKEIGYFEIMADEIARIEQITGELLMVAKPQVQQFHYENLTEIFQDVTTLLGSQALMNNVDIKVMSEDIPLVYCVAHQIKQVFINLIKNAIESMPTGGVIHVRLGSSHTGAVFIQVHDQGCGIPEGLLENIGIPFYTTKQKGTGLGMMTSFKIIESHTGTMEISSKEGEGTIVRISLPVHFVD